MATITTVTEHVENHEGQMVPITMRELVQVPGVVLEDWFVDLIRDGYCIVKGAVSKEHCEEYVQNIYELLESFKLGFDRRDPSTIHKTKLPPMTEKGILKDNAISHEDFVWKVRAEPGVISTFERIYNTEDLIVSFDAINVSFPKRTDVPKNAPWPHQDQNPKKPGFRCLQGLVNLLPNGPNDGGLVVMKGGHKLSNEFHKLNDTQEQEVAVFSTEYYTLSDDAVAWFASKGCEWVKVCADPGDLILWDSRAPHYNCGPEGDNHRMAVYTCYMPAAEASQEDLKKKKMCFENRYSTSHWPDVQFYSDNHPRREGVPEPDSAIRQQPLHEPVLSERAFKLTGIPYIKDE
ncbi:hypothetical protein BZA70DRAFT_100379 [Myxozyma melibiosi]|uniref:Phytanoyl-CoA dioxygenase n=1 Tax=Myxozyma melibiosi TaxID=54550 RepID=A0ABR1F0T6_9ASCO